MNVKYKHNVKSALFQLQKPGRKKSSMLKLNVSRAAASGISRI